MKSLIFASVVLLSFLAATGKSAFFWPDVPSTPENVLEQYLTTPPNNEAAAPCQDATLIRCQGNFNSFLNIPGHADWHVPLELYAALLRIYQNNGTRGLLQVCQAYTAFAQCLGNQYASCNNPLFYLQHGYSIVNAAYYPAIIAQLHFQCGGGLETAIYNWQCIQNMGKKYNQTLIACNLMYALNSSMDPAHACQYAANDIQCNRAPFQKNCNAPTGWYMCEYTRVGIASHLPMCTNLRCRVGASSEPDEPAPVLPMKDDEKIEQNLPDVSEETMGKLVGDQLKVQQEIAAHALKQQKEENKN